MRVLLDTNVLIAAFATRGLCEDVLRVVMAEQELVVSDFILDEGSRLLSNKLKPSPARVRAITKFIREVSNVVNPAGPEDWPESDPDDRWVVAAAIASDVDVLVSFPVK